MCHSIGGTGAELGPALDGWGRGKSADVIATAIVRPSAEIAHGYDGMELKTKDGLTIQGVLLKEGDPLMMRSMGGDHADHSRRSRRHAPAHAGIADDERRAARSHARRMSPTSSRSCAATEFTAWRRSQLRDEPVRDVAGKSGVHAEQIGAVGALLEDDGSRGRVRRSLLECTRPFG